MKIKLNQGSAGPSGYLPAGTTVTVDDATGKYLIDSRQGVEVKESFPEPIHTHNDAITIETATSPDVSTETWPSRRKKAEVPKEAPKEPA
jgi:hypothetical protein